MSKKNYYNKKAIRKLKNIAASSGFCMMLTQLNKRPISARPMSLQEVDDQGVLWFISNINSDKNYELRQNAETQLIFQNLGKSEYLSVFGKAEVYSDKIMIDKYWTEMAQAWFEKAKDDSSVSIIGIRPTDVKYWSTKYGKLVDFALLLYDAVTNSEASKDLGTEGKLEI